jgi:hypothetical protein
MATLLPLFLQMQTLAFGRFERVEQQLMFYSKTF